MVVHPLHTDIPKPERFTYPFNYEPHPLCQLAAKEVQRDIARINPREGKMFGVLVVEVNEKLKVKSPLLAWGFLLRIAGCWKDAMIGNISYLPYMMRNSQTATSRLRNVRFL